MLNEKNTKKSLLLKKAMIGMIAASTTLTGCSYDEDFDNSEQVEEVTEPEYDYAAVAYENDKAIIFKAKDVSYGTGNLATNRAGVKLFLLDDTTITIFGQYQVVYGENCYEQVRKIGEYFCGDNVVDYDDILEESAKLTK